MGLVLAAAIVLVIVVVIREGTVSEFSSGLCNLMFLVRHFGTLCGCRAAVVVVGVVCDICFFIVCWEWIRTHYSVLPGFFFLWGDRV